MVYFFHKSGRYQRVENRVVYELEVTSADGVVTVERFSTAAALTERERELQDQLLYEGWDGPHGPRD